MTDFQRLFGLLTFIFCTVVILKVNYPDDLSSNESDGEGCSPRTNVVKRGPTKTLITKIDFEFKFPRSFKTSINQLELGASQ